MGYSLPPSVTFCWVGSVPYFLDLKADRYFKLAGRSAEQFRALIAGDEIAQADAADLEAAGAIVCINTALSAFVAPLSRRFTRSIVEEASSSITLSSLSRAIFDTCRTSFALRSRSLSSVVDQLMAAKTLACGEVGLDHIEMVASTYRTLDFLVSSETRCLARSIAMARTLLTEGNNFELILGVRSGPFGAHCWLAQGDVVLNDRLDKVRDFTPILVI
ncbi:MAG: lasso peptide biosynthesis B2 protein [Sphingomonas sp.]|nr:lasso peptide biosynthesis B2 protein [Sphingomonas sp.]